jgi:hypothetical protein
MSACQIIPFPARGRSVGCPANRDTELLSLIREATDLVRRNGGRLFAAPLARTRQTPKLFLVPLFEDAAKDHKEIGAWQPCTKLGPCPCPAPCEWGLEPPIRAKLIVEARQAVRGESSDN